MKRILLYLMFGFILFSCSKSYDEQKLISKFPTIITFDTVSIIKAEAYDKNGKLEQYDSTIYQDYYLSFLKLYDTIIVVNPKSAIGYKYYSNGTSCLDTLDLLITENYLQIIPIHLKDTIQTIDTRVPGNMINIYDKDIIKKEATRIINSENNQYYIELNSATIYSKDAIKGSYSVVGQVYLNEVNKGDIYPYLETNETLLITNYRMIFREK
jgi:hypothetical protein